jgi:CubicO group peptidase (beta-lactamase class C family)
MKTIRAASVFLAFLASLALGAQGQEVFSFPKTSRGQRLAAYFAAFNSGDDERMTAFFKEHFAEQTLGQMSMPERLERYQAFKQQAGRLEPQRLVGESGNEIQVLAKDGQGQWLAIIFIFEPEKPEKILGIRVETVDEADVPDLSGPPLTRKQALDAAASLLDQQAKADLFSGVALIALRGEVLFHKAYGLANIEYGVANRLDTRFNLGSINKLFTNIAVEQLAEKGKLSLDDPVARFLPNYPNEEAAAKVTVRHLLDMTSGIGDFFGSEYEATPKDRIRELSDYLLLFASKPLLFEPGARREYSNGGYVVLGLIIEKASGKSYFDYVAENIYRPAGMEASGHLEADVPQTNVASGYTRLWDSHDHADEPRRNNIYTRPARGSSAGGGYATALDLLRFAEAWKAGKLLGPAMMARLGGPGAYAGGAPGINAELDIDPAPGYTVVVLSNYDPPAATAVAKKISALVRRIKE